MLENDKELTDLEKDRIRILIKWIVIPLIIILFILQSIYFYNYWKENKCEYKGQGIIYCQPKDIKLFGQSYQWNNTYNEEWNITGLMNNETSNRIKNIS